MIVMLIAAIENLPGGGFLAPALGLVATGGSIGGAVWYIIKFQRAFTDRLEESNTNYFEEINGLKVRLSLAEAEERRCQWKLAHLIYIMRSNGMTVPRDVDLPPPDLFPPVDTPPETS